MPEKGTGRSGDSSGSIQKIKSLRWTEACLWTVIISMSGPAAAPGGKTVNAAISGKDHNYSNFPNEYSQMYRIVALIPVAPPTLSFSLWFPRCLQPTGLLTG